MITIVNYGLGNVQAFVQAYKRIGVPTRLAATAKQLEGAERLILPGVGAFDWAMGLLGGSGMRDTLDDIVLDQKRPVLGVCVGMQMMAHSSSEGKLPGLGWIDGTVERLGDEGEKVDLPHMGWNDVAPQDATCLFRGMEKDASFYFLHSYYMKNRNADDTLGVTDYGQPFTAAVRSGNVWGVQFHPEKSHQWGTRLLKNFAEVR
jgi:glutamine amidotransferase